jgi:hypothetical protein
MKSTIKSEDIRKNLVMPNPISAYLGKNTRYREDINSIINEDEKNGVPNATTAMKLHNMGVVTRSGLILTGANISRYRIDYLGSRINNEHTKKGYQNQNRYVHQKLEKLGIQDKLIESRKEATSYEDSAVVMQTMNKLGRPDMTEDEKLLAETRKVESIKKYGTKNKSNSNITNC